MKVAVMQPYLLPYIGYWELYAAADLFVVLDDVQFVRRGWVNRNRLRSDRPGLVWAYLTVPVTKARRETPISDIMMRLHSGWGQELSRRIVHLYGRDALECDLVQDLISLPSRSNQTLLPALLRLLSRTSAILQLETPVVLASEIDPKPKAVGQQRLIDLVLGVNGSEYLNLPGGQRLYDPNAFSEFGIELHILSPTGFRPWASCGLHLSVLDGILAGDLDRMRAHLSGF